MILAMKLKCTLTIFGLNPNEETNLVMGKFESKVVTAGFKNSESCISLKYTAKTRHSRECSSKVICRLVDKRYPFECGLDEGGCLRLGGLDPSLQDAGDEGVLQVETGQRLEGVLAHL